MKKLIKKCIVLFLSVMTCFLMFPAETFADDLLIQGNEGFITGKMPRQTYKLNVSQGNDELFSEYIEAKLYSDNIGVSLRKAKRVTPSGVNGNIYNKLKEGISLVADGVNSSSVFEVSLNDLALDNDAWTADELGVEAIITEEGGEAAISQQAMEAAVSQMGINLDIVLNSLLADCPYELYWYDKTVGISMDGPGFGATFDGNDWVLTLESGLTFYFAVAEGYASGEYVVDATKAERVRYAVNKAAGIREAAAELNDYQKLVYYKEEICGLVSYDYEASEDDTIPYGDPWQIISVFDEDPDTNVVCEGYSKALQYLCDKTDFSGDISCISATGVMRGGIGEGNHMWNVVNMEDGLNYMVDVTNCDEDSIGEPDQLLLAGYDGGTMEDGYTFTCEGDSITYTYDDDALNTYTESDLTISNSDYVYHEWGEWVTITEATCISEGEEKRTCGLCGEEQSRTIEFSSHLLTKVEAKEATLREDGNIEYWYCSACDKYFSDEEGVNEITAESVVIPKTGGEIIESGTCGASGDNLTWSLDENGVLVISGTGEMYNPYIDVPWYGKDIKHVIIEEGVTSIGDNAFYRCSSLKSITIPEGVTNIGGHAFNGCSSLKNITIPEGVTRIGDYAFYECSNLTSISIPEGVTNICNGAFESCSSLTSITIPGSVVSIMDQAFANCSSLISVTITEGVASIGKQAFSNCSSLTSITVPGSVSYYIDEAFSGCSSLTSITFLEGVTGIGHSTFYACSSLTSITIPESVMFLDADELNDCSNLASIYVIKDSYADTWLKDNNFSEKIKYVYKSGEHDYYETILKKPTCEEPGIKHLLCVVCNEETNEQIPALGHNITKVEAKEATEFEEGNIEYWLCSVCGKYFADENGTQEISADSIVVPKTDPTYAELSWNIDDDGVLTVSGEGRMPDFDKASDAPWYSERTNIKKIIVSEGLTTIGSRAFYQCSNVTEVEITSTVKTIGAWAFYNNSSLAEVTIPKGVISLGDSAFRACSSLSKIQFEGNAPTLGNYVFTDTASDLAIHHYENAEGWDAEAWANYNVVADHKIGEFTVISEPSCTEPGTKQGVCEICGETITEEIPALGHDYVDGYCKRCGEIEVLSNGKCGENVNYILYGDGELIISGSGSMYNWPRNTSVPWYVYSERIETITIENGITSIGDGAFWGCSLLTDITIPNSVTILGNSAFRGCSNLVKITIPENTISIGRLAFCECSSLTNINIPEGISSIEYQAFSKCNSLTNITIPNGVINICEGAFSGCSSLTKIIIPESVKSIEPTAFSGCSNLTTITIPEGVTIIGGGTFENCSSLTGITIPESVTSIGENAFSGCSSLTSIAIPDSVTGIGKGAFWNCSSLASITLPFIGGNSTGNNHFGYIFGASSHLGNDSYVPSSLKEVVITGDITSIETDAFYKCSSIKSITIPNGVTGIEMNAFSDCSSLENITIPEGVVSIGAGAFFACYNLKSIEIPDSVDEIGVVAFSNCTSLERIVIPEKVKMIDTETLYYCTNLKEIIILGDTTGISGKAAFDGCSSLSNIFVIKGSPADSWILQNGYQEKLIYIYESGDHYFYDTLVEATCTSSGSRSSLCVVCGEEITENIPALGHDWSEPTYVWNTDHSCMTATFVCRNDSSHKDTVIAEGSAITSEITKEPTTAAPGEKVYTASITFDGKTYTATDTVVIPKLQQVIRIFGSTRYETSLNVARELKERLGGEKFKAVVVTNGGFYPDALSGSYLSCTLKAPVLLMDTSRGRISAVQEFIKENLEPGGMVYLLGGTAVVPDSVMTGLNGFKHHRLGGATRYETNIAIIKETARVSGEEVRELIVCSGNGFADSLSAAATGKPIMILNTTLLDCQKDYLSSLKGNGLKITIVGGSGVISNALANSLSAYGEIDERVWGQTRYETSAKVAGKFFPKTTSGIIALGTNFPDGLCGGVLANTIGGPMVLVANGTTANAEEYAEASGMSSGIVLGGPALVNDATVKAVFHAE